MIKKLAGLGAILDPRGRMSRSAYNRRLIRILLAFVGLGSLSILAASLDVRFAALMILAIAIVATGALAVAATIRRLHDRDRTGWWLLPNTLATLAGFAPIETFADAYPVAVIVATLALTGFSLWFLIETLGYRGTAGWNRYGAEPAP
ncbi:DUF805 domain-containing protein [Methylobacterium sp. 77]|uniref:DUF805 domain-containing protein n=1 Tax=Methylobacterium sp. 77 TaxID=1101192 RepID=UPI00036CB8C0|nr:DUF805 domain-containing protein [Methylobacterium sp. 77]